jgi:hypothetical protein
MATPVKKNFNSFTEDNNIALTDRFVGFKNASFSGERKWSFQNVIDNINKVNEKTDATIKAWVQYDIANSVWIPRASFNVASVTKGTHSNPSWNKEVSHINFTNPMDSADYAVVASFNFYDPNQDIYHHHWNNLWPVNAMPYTKSQCRLYHYHADSHSYDTPYIISVIVVSK